MEIPVFIFTGFLDSGKTTLLRDTLESPDFFAYRTLIIACEDGDEEYDAAFLKKNKAFLVQISKEEDLTDAFLQECAKRFDPDQVMIEFNGTWPIVTILERRLPKHWEICGMYSTIDTTTVDTYLTSMRSFFMEQFSQTGLIIFNRCAEDVDRARLRRIFKAFNPPVQIVFEREDGEMYDPADEPLPYDISGPVVTVPDLDYGVWYLDAGEHPEHYLGKTIRFRAQVYRGRNLRKGTFVPGRFIMTCCVEDIRFMGYVCTFADELPFKQRDWVEVEVSFGYGFVREFGEKAPMLTLVSVKAADPAEVDPVFLN